MATLKLFGICFLSLGLQSRISKKAKDLDEATQLILPGVGSFDAKNEINISYCKQNL